MSNEVHAMAKKRKVGSSLRKAILLYMADQASDDGTGIWSSKRNIAADLETTDRTVRREIAKMIEAGLIVEAGKRECANGFTVDYSIQIEAVRALPSTRPPDTRSGGTHGQGGPLVRGTPDHVSAKPPVEPSLDPIGPKECARADLFDDDREETKQRRDKDSARLPLSWVPDDADLQFARDEGLTDQEIVEIAESYRTYFTEGKKKNEKRTERGWRTSWKNWVRRDKSTYIRNRRMDQRRVGGSYNSTDSFADIIARRGESGG